MLQCSMSLIELYIELLRRSCERERFSIYARFGTFMEQYRETRDESLINEFKLMFKRELIIKGLLYNYKHGIDDCTSESPTRVPINCKNRNVRGSYSRLEHFEDCIKAYQ